MGLDILLAEGPLTLVAEDHRDVSENQMDKVLDTGGFHCYPAQGFAADEPLQPLDAQGELAEGEGALPAQPS